VRQFVTYEKELRPAAEERDYPSDSEGTPLLHLKRGADVQLESAARDLPELALLTTLGWYLHKQQEEEAAAVTSIVLIMG
jgi:hypothetical protein